VFMQYQMLGRSSLRISRIGFGCMSLKPEQKDIQTLIDEAVSNGINYFDTADLYDKGLNEVNIGNALKTKRHQIILASKAGNQWRSDGSGWDWNPNKDYILKAVEKSLMRLQTDYIDLYQLHGGTINDPIDETIEAFEILQKQGKIRYYGISSIRPNVIREYVKRSHIVSVMMQYSLLDRRPEESCLQLLEQNNIAVLARGSVASGLLIDKPPRPYLNYGAAEVSNAAKAIQQLVTPQRNAAHIALQFVLQQKGITAAIVGIRTKKQLTDALQALDLPLLTEQELGMLGETIPVNHYQEHRQ
jgi:aryl-alcohol dehydrogenase-like predicted oxidoreductase